MLNSRRFTAFPPSITKLSLLSLANAALPPLPPLLTSLTIDGNFNKLSGGNEPTVLFEAGKTNEKMYQLSAVIAVVAAASIAHFALVVGGFTGDRGMAKLEALRNWLFTH